jgi:hypothetical protein
MSQDEIDGGAGGPPQTLMMWARRLQPVRGEFSKPDDFYKIYESYFAPLRESAMTMLEVGVHEGESTKTFSRYFSRGRIIGIDLKMQDIDFSRFPNVTYVQANQTDGNALRDLAAQHAPDGYDIILDDASHIGYFSLLTLQHTFGQLKPGDLYIIEDWGTGYWPEWGDGGAYQRYPVAPYQAEIPRRLPSHDFGMVGFVKQLVDITAGGDVRGEGPMPALGSAPFEFMHVFPGTVVIRKRAP